MISETLSPDYRVSISREGQSAEKRQNGSEAIAVRVR